MKFVVLWIGVATGLAFLGCSGDDSDESDRGGSGAAAGSTTTGGTTGSGGGGTAGSSGGGTGGDGTGGTSAGGTTAGSDCETCVACVNDSCEPELADCELDAECGAIYTCTAMCGEQTADDCIAEHPDGLLQWAMVSACLNQNCLSVCQ